jgi:hypothetical protein
MAVLHSARSGRRRASDVIPRSGVALTGPAWVALSQIGIWAFWASVAVTAPKVIAQFGPARALRVRRGALKLFILQGLATQDLHAF